MRAVRYDNPWDYEASFKRSYESWECDFCGEHYSDAGPDAPPTKFVRGEYKMTACQACVNYGLCDTCKQPDALGVHTVEEGHYECDACYTHRLEG